MIPGMKNFFGEKMGRFVGSHATHMSPIKMQHLKSAHSALRAEGNSHLKSAYGAMKAGWQGGQQLRKAQGLNPYMISDYFGGRNMMDGLHGVKAASAEVMKRRKLTRLAVPGVVVGGAALSAVIGDNPLSAGARTATTAAAVTGVAGAMGRWGGTAGAVGSAALMAAAGINLVRRGDNLGPF